MICEISIGNVPSVLDQADRYAKTIGDGGWGAAGGPWLERKLPFVFATNGRPWLAQLAEASGIWFRDLRRAGNAARPLEVWYSPENLVGLLTIDAVEAEKKLDDFGFELDFPLRYYQKEAILAAENAIRGGGRRILLAMATGKTKTCIALLLRLLATGMFRRALFLVDRNVLGEQAGNAFKETKIRSLRLVVVDECHRGYLLDRELSDDELEFRSYEDFISKDRRVLKHFDAVRIGLTATPARILPRVRAALSSPPTTGSGSTTMSSASRRRSTAAT